MNHKEEGMFSPDAYLDYLYQEAIANQEQKDQNQLLVKFEELLGDFSGQDQPLNPEIIEKVELDGYTRLGVVISTVKHLKMPVYVLIPNHEPKKKKPAVLAIHGHGYGNKALVGLNHDGTRNDGGEYHKNFAIELVKRGTVVLVPELVGFGDRKRKVDQGIGKPTDNSCYMIASQLLLVGKTLAGLRVHECKRVLDFIETLTEVDQDKIACMGISGGGLVAGFTSALDQRIRATVISGYTNTFKTSIMARRHCLDNYIPGILNEAEMPEWLGLIAPMPLFIEAGTEDHLFPVEYVHYAIERLTTIYRSFNAESMLDAHIFPGGHEINGQKSFDWIINQLT